MNRVNFHDKLEVMGILAGTFVIIMALSTLVGLPWTTTEFTGPAVVQVIGILLTLGLGAVIIVFTRVDGD